MVQATLEARGTDACVDRPLGVEIEVELLPEEPEGQVADAHDDPHPPALVGVDEAIEHPRSLHRPVDERRPVAVAAHDVVEGDDVGGQDLLCDLDEIRVPEGGTVAEPAPLDLAAGCGEVGA